MLALCSNRLHPGVQLCGASGLDVSRVQLSSGTVPVSQLSELDASQYIPYLPDAFVPDPNWRELSFEEWQMLDAGGCQPFRVGTSIGMLRIPDPVLTPLTNVLDDLGLRFQTNIRSFEPDYERIQNHVDYQTANQTLWQHVRQYSRSMPDVKLIGLHLQPVGLRTVTVSFDAAIPPQRCRVGLHVDNWNALPLLQRHRSNNRICINLGREDRFFLFINQPLFALLQSLNSLGSTWSNPFYHQPNFLIALSKTYMKHYPTYPVIQLRLAPGEAYIAPTDNLIHDATSVGKRYPDITWTALGQFELP